MLGDSWKEGWTLNEREKCDLEMLLSGAFAPLDGYMTEEQYSSVVHKMCLPNGDIWPLPIVLAIPKSYFKDQSSKENLSDATKKSQLQVIKLRDQLGAVIGELQVEDVYEPDIDAEMQHVIGSTDMNHPFNKVLEAQRDCLYVGGKVREVHPILHFDFRDLRLSPAQLKNQIKEEGWDAVVAFQTRNPMHRSHFELTQQAVAEVESQTGKKALLVLTPVVGPTQPGDVEYHVRVRCYKKILKYYCQRAVKLVILPVAMRMAGPREAVWHAIIRRNYGCTHFIVGRDHAGPSAKTQDGKTFYGAYDAHELLKSVQNELGVTPVYGRSMVYVGEEHGGYLQECHVPPGVDVKTISGTEVRRMLTDREHIPEWFSFSDVTEELQKVYQPPHKRGLCIYFTGLPCAGKSTLASAVEAAVVESDYEQRRVTLLDADVVRTHLSQGLGYSREDRTLNVRRIGYVASEIVKHKGICLVANIAPYAEDRMANRKLVEAQGGSYVEVYVSTPLEVCEQRDVKELYKRARQGIITQFTGVSDTYDTPVNPELVVDSSENIVEKVTQVMEFLRKRDLIVY